MIYDQEDQDPFNRNRMTPEEQRAFQALVEGDPTLTSGSISTPWQQKRDLEESNMQMGGYDPSATLRSGVAVDPWLRAHNPIATPDPRTELPEQAPGATWSPSGQDVMSRFAQAHQANTSGGGGGGGGGERRSYGGGTVPEAQDAFDTPGLALAALADLALNKGRSVPQFIALGAQNEDNAWETQKRQMEADRNAAEIQRMQQGPAGQDPAVLQMRQEALDLRRSAQEQSGASFTQKKKLDQIKLDRSDPDSPVSQRARQIAGSRGIQDYDGMSAEDLSALNPTINFYAQRTGPAGEADTRHAAQKAAAEAAATEASRTRVAEAGAARTATAADEAEKRAVTREGREAARRLTEEEKDQAREFDKDTQNETDALRILQDLRDQNEGQELEGTGPVQGLVPDVMASPKALETRGKLRMLQESWGRARSGASIGMTEGQKFAMQTGTKETATDQEIRAAQEVLRSVLEAKVQAKAVGREGAAKKVLKAKGIRQAPQPQAEPEGIPVKDPRTGKKGRFKGTAEKARSLGYEVL